MTKRVYEFIVAYDIADDKERYALDLLLKGWGHRVQKSVYSVQVSRYQTVRLHDEIARLGIKTGTVLLYRVQSNIAVKAFGLAFEDPKDALVYII